MKTIASILFLSSVTFAQTTIQRRVGNQPGGAIGGGSQPLIVNQNSYGLVPSGRLPVATEFNDGVMSMAEVAALGKANRPDRIGLYLSTSGSDANSGLSASTPFLTLRKALDYAASHGNGYVINILGGGNSQAVFTLDAGVVFPSNQYGSSAVPLLITSPMWNVFGNHVNNAPSANGSVFTDTTLVGIRQTAGLSVTSGAPTNCMRIPIAGYVAGDVGKIVKLSLSANPGNNGDMQIAGVNPGVSIDVYNPQKVVPDAGPITVTDSLYGAYVDCISGACAGNRRMIRSNTLTSFEVKNPFGVAISNGDVFAVLKPGAVIQYTNQLTFAGGFIGFQGIKLQNRSSLGFPLALSGSQTVWDSCEVDAFSTVASVGGAMNSVQNAQLFAGVFSVTNLRNWHNDDSLFPAGHQGAGIFYHGGSFTVDSPSGFEGTQVSRVNGFFTLLQSGLEGFEAASLNLTSLDAERTSGQFERGCGVTMQAQTASYPSKWNGQFLSNSSIGLLTFKFGSVGTVDGIDLSNSGGDAVLCANGCNIQVNKVTGSGNAGAGLHVDRYSYIQIDSGGSGNTTVTGTAGDSKFGHPATPDIETYATLRTLVPAVTGQAGYQDAYGNRIEP